MEMVSGLYMRTAVLSPMVLCWFPAVVTVEGTRN